MLQSEKKSRKMREIKLLIVDDDDEVIEEFKNSIEICDRDYGTNVATMCILPTDTHT